MPVSGTSCATPCFSGVVALLNDARLAAGKSTLGFLNPMLYHAASVAPRSFNDVTEGANMGCGESLFGFEANTGWDPATGLGTPNFQALRDYVLSLP